MIGTRDVLDEIADWYSPPESSTTASDPVTVLRSPFVPLSIYEKLWSLVAVVEQLLMWHDRARQRCALLRLSDDVLSDIGISRAEALNEAGKAFWRS